MFGFLSYSAKFLRLRLEFIRGVSANFTDSESVLHTVFPAYPGMATPRNSPKALYSKSITLLDRLIC